MSEISYIPSTPPFNINDHSDINVTILPITYDVSIVYFKNKSEDRIPIPNEIDIFDYTENKKLEFDRTASSVGLISSNSYRINYKNKPIFSCRVFDNSTPRSLSDICNFPFTSKEFVQYNSTKYASIVKGNITKGSHVIKVSSTFGIEPDRFLEAEWIDYFAYVTNVDHDNNEVTISEPSLETATNITITIH